MKRTPAAIAAGAAACALLFVASPFERFSEADLVDLRRFYRYALEPCTAPAESPDDLVAALERHPDQDMPLEGAGFRVTPRELAQRAILALRSPRSRADVPGGSAARASSPCAIRASRDAATLEAALRLAQ
jgi:hypothetical protein